MSRADDADSVKDATMSRAHDAGSAKDATMSRTDDADSERTETDIACAPDSPPPLEPASPPRSPDIACVPDSPPPLTLPPFLFPPPYMAPGTASLSLRPFLFPPAAPLRVQFTDHAPPPPERSERERAAIQRLWRQPPARPPPRKPTHRCTEPDCVRTFFSETALAQHIKRHRQHSLPCPAPHCHRRLASRAGLAHHWTAVHRELAKLDTSAIQPVPNPPV
jgi:hypothetical protein